MVYVQAVMVWRADKIDAVAWVEHGLLRGAGSPRLTIAPMLRESVDREIARMNQLTPQNSHENQVSRNSDDQAD